MFLPKQAVFLKSQRQPLLTPSGTLFPHRSRRCMKGYDPPSMQREEQMQGNEMKIKT